MTTATLPDPTTLPAATAGTTVGQFVDSLSSDQKRALLERLMGDVAPTLTYEAIPLTSRDGQVLGVFVPRRAPLRTLTGPPVLTPEDEERGRRSLANRHDAVDLDEMLAEINAQDQD